MRSFLTVLACLLILPARSQGLSEKVNSYIHTYTQTNDFSGCVSIVQNDVVVYEHCFGNSNYTFGVKNIPSTKFKIGSISKQFTAVGILRLEEQGVLSLDDPIKQYFPAIPNIDTITILHLLTHTSGIIDIFNLSNFSTYNCQSIDLAALVNQLLKQALNAPPGQQYQYSNGGYAILARIIEIVSKQSFSGYMRAAIFEPLGLNATGHTIDHAIIPQLASGYEPLGYDQLKPTPLIRNALLQGSGSLYSNLNDLKKWVAQLRDRTFLQPASYDKLFRNYGNSYGLGISGYQVNEQSVFGHDGRINGYIADYLHFKEANTSIIILGNIQTGVADFLRRDIAAIVFEKDYNSNAKQATPASSYPEDYLKTNGAYHFGPGLTVYIETINNKLQAKANEGGYSELVPLANGRYFSRTLYATIDFEENQKGEVERMIWINNEGRQFIGIKQ